MIMLPTFEIHIYDRFQILQCKTFFSRSSGSVFDKSAIMELNESVSKKVMLSTLKICYS